jgi:hypothetical protein
MDMPDLQIETVTLPEEAMQTLAGYIKTHG